MNAGSYIGRAAAFELNVLANLNDVKTTANRRTLLHFLVEIIQEKQSDLLNFGVELCHLLEASHVNTDDVDEAIKEIEGMLDYIKSELEIVNESHPASDDKFVGVMSSFTSKCYVKLQELMKMKKHMQIRCIEVAKFFAVDTKKYRITEFFKDIATFTCLFTQKSMNICKSSKPGKMTEQAGRLYQESIKCKKSNVIRRDFRIKLNRLSTKGLYLYF